MKTKTLLRSATLFTALLAATGCGEEDLPGACPHDLRVVFDSSFGQVEIDALLEATGQFATASRNIDAKIASACNAIAGDLGAETSDDTATACSNASAAIDAVVAANSAVTISIEALPPVCSASIDALVECTAACDANFDASATPPVCEGGELSGSCSGSCEGSCSVEGSAECTGSCDLVCAGSCEGTVSGSCDGTCTGQCDGECSAKDGDGNCMGECTGTCSGECSGQIEGSCSGTCTGGCSGECRVAVSGSCEGSCTGSCDVDFVEPSCEGGSIDVEASAECEAACESEVAFEVECNEPQVVVTFQGGSAPDLLALANTLQANYGRILAATAQLPIVADATANLAASIGDASAAAAEISLEAADCMRLAVETQLDAAASIQVSVMATVEINASVSAAAE